jgi:hypothetical protein
MVPPTTIHKEGIFINTFSPEPIKMAPSTRPVAERMPNTVAISIRSP